MGFTRHNGNNVRTVNTSFQDNHMGVHTKTTVEVQPVNSLKNSIDI